MKFEVITLDKKVITDFAKERNTLLINAKRKWAFFLDSDESFSKGLKKEIDNLPQNSKAQSYFVRRNNFFLSKYVGEDKILRLIRKGSGKWVRAVHETYQTNKYSGDLKNPIIHNTSDNLRGYINKINFYSSLHAIENEKEKKHSNLFKIIFFPIFKFFETLFKSRNIVFSIMQSFHSFLSWSKQYLEKNNK